MNNREFVATYTGRRVQINGMLEKYYGVISHYDEQYGITAVRLDGRTECALYSWHMLELLPPAKVIPLPLPG